MKIVIVGGGTAGWMTAVTLAKLAGKVVSVTLVESDEIGTVGVGEATIPQIMKFNEAIGLDENAFLRATNGTFKLGIQFVDWIAKGQSYIHGFGHVGRDLGLLPFYQYWLAGRAKGLAQDIADYSVDVQACHLNRFARPPVPLRAPMQGLSYAFHFDAGLYAQYLRTLAEASGAVRIEGRVTHVAQHPETGFLQSVTLADGRVVEGDFFVDCSGFVGLLIEQTLHAGYVDWSHWLPCDRALAVPCEGVRPLTPFTRSTARQAGWQWRIPLTNRIGNGHVYCSSFISDEEAANTLLANLDGKPLADPRPIRFTTGHRRKFWDKNCVAIGLASGFMEPLESTSIHLIQAHVARVVKYLPTKAFDPVEIDEYNRLCLFEFEAIRDFLILHYTANQREEPFWRACREMSLPDSLVRKMEVFAASGRIHREHEELFAESSWMQVMLGQGIVPRAYHPLADGLGDAKLEEFLFTVRTLVEREVAALPTHEQYLEYLASRPAA